MNSTIDNIADQEFKEIRKNAFSSSFSNEEIKIANKYTPESLSKSILSLQELLKKCVKFYTKVIDSMPKEYISLQTLLDNSRINIERSNLNRKVLQVFDIKNLVSEYIDKDTEGKKDFNSIKNECKIFYANYYNNHIKIISKKSNKPKDKCKNKYLFQTFSPEYTIFLIIHNDLIFKTNDSFLNFNCLIKDANDMLDEFDKDDTPQKILISYLLERGTGLNFKFSLFHKTIEFSEKLKKWNLENISEEFLLKEYIKYFVCFRDLYLFYEDRFFAEVDNIVSGILEAQQKYIRDAKDSVNPNVLELLSTDRIHQIIKELYDFMIELISNSTNNTSDFDKFKNQFENKFDNPTNRIKYNKKLWKLTQKYINLHIATDYNNTYFDTVPQFNMYKYESSINFHLQMMFYKDSTL